MKVFGVPIEMFSMIVVGSGVIASYVRLKELQQSEKARLDALELKQKTDHEEILELQRDKDKALWGELKRFQETLYGIGTSLGKLEGKIDYLRKDHDE